MKVHWKGLAMSVKMGDTTVTLKGDPSLTKTQVTLKRMTKSWEIED